MMKRSAQGILVLLCILISATALKAQEQAPASGIDDSGGESVQQSMDDDAPAFTADNRPLTGGQSIGVGSRGPRHSFFVPGFRVSQTVDSNPAMTVHSDYHGFTSLDGELQMIQYLGRDADIRYAGAVRFDTRSQTEGVQQFTNAHSLAISKLTRFTKWDLLFDDELQYTQGSNFGATGMEGLGSVITTTSQWGGVSNIQLESTALQPNLVPNQSILTLRSGRLSNTILGEADYQINDRNAFTMTGYYGLLHFTESGLIDTSQRGFVGGYNRAVSQRDTLAVEYGFSTFGFSGTSQDLWSQYMGLLYGHRLTGQIALSAGAGPQYSSSHTSGATYTDLGWQGRGMVDWQFRRAGLHVGVLRTLTGGSGVLFGAYTNAAQGSVSYSPARNWDSSLDFGFSRNRGLGTELMYNTQYAGFSATRHIGQNRDAFFSYNLQHQTSSGCAATTCAVNGIRHVFGVGIAWSHQPIGVY